MNKNLLGSILISAASLCGSLVQAQCFNCGNGSEGAKVISSDQTLSGEHNYTNFTVEAGVVVTVTGNSPLVIKATGNVLINGTINANGTDGTGRVAPAQSNGGGGKGGDAGTGTSSAWAPGTNGAGPGGGLGATCDDNMSGGGGGFYSPFKGGGGGCNNGGGTGYADKYLLDFPAGSGGGGASGFRLSNSVYGNGGCGGGGGGAVAILSCGTITIGSGGSIQADGGLGYVTNYSQSGGNGGGGSGGSIYLSSAKNAVVNNGSLSAKGAFLGGANGVASGGTGAIRIDGAVSGTGNTGSAYKYNPNYFDSAVVALMPLAPCAGQTNGKDSLVLNNLGTGYQINWSNGDTSQVISNLSSGNYSVTVTNINGCSKVLSNNIPNAAAISGNIATTPTASNTGMAIASPTGGTPPFTYEWSNGLSGDTGKNYAPGSYNVTITDANGCSATEQFTISLISGIDDMHNAASIGLYPNPANDKLFVTTQQPTAIFITNAFGQIVLKGNAENSLVFNVAELSPGIYFVHNQNLTAKARFIKQ